MHSTQVGVGFFLGRNVGLTLSTHWCLCLVKVSASLHEKGEETQEVPSDGTGSPWLVQLSGVLWLHNGFWYCSYLILLQSSFTKAPSIPVPHKDNQLGMPPLYKATWIVRDLPRNCYRIILSDFFASEFATMACDMTILCGIYHPTKGVEGMSAF